MKAGKVVIVLAGRYAGKKAVIVKTFTGENQKARNFGHCLIAGIAKNPRPVTKSMSKVRMHMQRTSSGSSCAGYDRVWGHLCYVRLIGHVSFDWSCRFNFVMFAFRT